MAIIKRLRSVIHSTAHHAISGLCYVHPHLGEACKENKLQTVTINLVQLSLEPELKNTSKELKLSLSALQEKFNELLKTENIAKSEIKSTLITFNFTKGAWPRCCYIEAETTKDKKLVVALDSIGKKAEVLYESS